ncbi:MAG: hypothetical protein II077_00255, partial [Treponema sp.]|nr:hypothetical protein [Treponema sp.]
GQKSAKKSLPQTACHAELDSASLYNIVIVIPNKKAPFPEPVEGNSYNILIVIPKTKNRTQNPFPEPVEGNFLHKSFIPKEQSPERTCTQVISESVPPSIHSLRMGKKVQKNPSPKQPVMPNLIRHLFTT